MIPVALPHAAIVDIALNRYGVVAAGVPVGSEATLRPAPSVEVAAIGMILVAAAEALSVDPIVDVSILAAVAGIGEPLDRCLRRRPKPARRLCL